MSKDSSSELSPRSSGLERWVVAALHLIGTVLLFVVSQIVAAVLVVGFLMIFAGYGQTQVEDAIGGGSSAVLFALAAVTSAIMVAALYALYRVRKSPFWSGLSLARISPPKLVGHVAANYGLYFLSFLVFVTAVSAYFPGLNTEQSQQLGFQDLVGYDYFFAFLSLVILPPFVEEIVFRGFLFKRLETLVFFWPAALLTSLVFGVAHMEFFSGVSPNWIAALDTFIFSLFLIRVLKRSGTLWASIVLHGLKNAIAFSFLFLL